MICSDHRLGGSAKAIVHFSCLRVSLCNLLICRHRASCIATGPQSPPCKVRPDWCRKHGRRYALARRRVLIGGSKSSFVGNDFEPAIRELKARLDGEIDVAGPDLAGSLTRLGLIDEYRLYLHPIVLGRGTPFFAGPRPPLGLVDSNRIGENVIRLTYVRA